MDAEVSVGITEFADCVALDEYAVLVTSLKLGVVTLL
jgi:hypothetical protein